MDAMNMKFTVWGIFFPQRRTTNELYDIADYAGCRISNLQFRRVAFGVQECTCTVKGEVLNINEFCRTMRELEE